MPGGKVLGARAVGRRRRMAVAVVAAAVSVMVALAAVPASGSTSLRYTYVADRYTGSDLEPIVAAAVREHTGERVALLGKVRFRAQRDRFTMTIDDLGTRVGGVPVTVWHEGRQRHLCVPVRTATTVSGIRSGELVHLTVWDAVAATWQRVCPLPGGTAGTLTIAL